MTPSGPNSNDIEYVTWRTPEHPIAIHCPSSVLEQLRQAGEEGFQKIPRGGLEVGGVLFGEYKPDGVWIRDWRPIACEHALGPGFVLSEGDQSGLQYLLEAAMERPEMAGMRIVGWFHTHTRSGLHLTPEDVAIHQRFFPEPWQVALLMRFSKDSPVRAGYFVSEPDGSIRTEASYQEFEVRPNPMALVSSPRPTMPPRRDGGQSGGPGAAALARRQARLAGAIPPAAAGMPPVESAPAGTVAGSRPEIGIPRSTTDGETVPEPATELSPASAVHPAVFAPPPRRSGFRKRILMLMVFAAGLAGLGIGGRWYLLSRPPEDTGLRLEEIEDQLIVRWNHSAAPVRTADRGVLQIRDGSQIREIALTSAVAQRGSVTYVREAEDVEVRLTLYQAGRPTMQEFARFVGAPPKARPPAKDDPAATDQERKQLRMEAERLRQALQRETERGQRLQETIRNLEQRVRR